MAPTTTPSPKAGRRPCPYPLTPTRRSQRLQERISPAAPLDIDELFFAAPRFPNVSRTYGRQRPYRRNPTSTSARAGPLPSSRGLQPSTAQCDTHAGKAKPFGANEMLQAGIRVVEATGTCKICTFCGECLLTVFETSLLDNLRRSMQHDGSHHNHEEGQCQSLPKSKEEMEELLDYIDLHDQQAVDIFRHPCPSYFCEMKTRKAPVVNYALRDTLEYMIQPLEGRFEPEVSETAGTVVRRSFDIV